MANFPSQARTVTAQELYGPVSLDAMGRIVGQGAGNVARGVGTGARKLYEAPIPQGILAANIANVASQFGAGVRSGFTGENYTGNEYRGLSLKDMLGGQPPQTGQASVASVPAARKVQPPAARQVQTQAPAQPSRMAPQLPKFAFDAQSGTTAYQIDPSARDWRPAHEGGAPSGYAGPLDYIRVARDPRSGVLSFSGTGQKITPQGEAYQPPPQAPLSQSQRDVMEVQSHFKGGVPQTREDWALFEGMLDNIVKQRESGAGRQQQWDMQMAQLMGQMSNRKQPNFQDQLGQELYKVGIQKFQNDPQGLLSFLLEMYTKQQRLQRPTDEE